MKKDLKAKHYEEPTKGVIEYYLHCTCTLLLVLFLLFIQISQAWQELTDTDELWHWLYLPAWHVSPHSCKWTIPARHFCISETTKIHHAQSLPVRSSHHLHAWDCSTLNVLGYCQEVIRWVIAILSDAFNTEPSEVSENGWVIAFRYKFISMVWHHEKLIVAWGERFLSWRC